MMSRGPAALKTEQLDQFRYHITGRVEDLRDPRDADEVIATGAWLYAALAEFIPRANGAWAGTGKWIPRSLRALDAGLEGEFAKAFDALFAGRDPGPVIIFAEKALAPFGGLLFDGYESQMPASSRLAGSEPLPRDR
jgi:hypothetical protein